jgi:hypothetical protein
MRIAFRPRRAIVTFRLSADEYELVKKASEAVRSRSLSDYAREAVMTRVALDTNPPKQDSELPGITASLAKLDAAMSQLDGKLSTILNSPAFAEHSEHPESPEPPGYAESGQVAQTDEAS